VRYDNEFDGYPYILGSREITLQSKTFLDDGHYQIQDGFHRWDPIGSSIELYT